MDEYQRVLRKNHSLDFDDLLSECVRLVEGHPHLVAGIRHTFVDEFQVSSFSISVQVERDAFFRKTDEIAFIQDTNTTQYKLMK